MELVRGRVRSVLEFFLLEKECKKKAASLLSLSFSPQRVARLSPVGHQPRIQNGIKGKNHFCGLEPSNSAAAYDATRTYNASARDSAVVSATAR